MARLVTDYRIKAVHGNMAVLVRWRWWHALAAWAWRWRRWCRLRRGRSAIG